MALEALVEAGGQTKEICIFRPHMEPNPITPLPHMAGMVLNDLRHYLTVIEPVVYQAPLALLSGSTIGQHTRHIIEFYHCLIEQYDSPGSIIDYAKRRRDHQIESAPDHALRSVDEIVSRLHDLDPGKTCFLDSTEHGQKNLLVSSTIGRELIYNIEHTIHHLAIVKIALKATAPSIDLPEHFGVAPSTIQHRQELCAQ
jgi:hypothetical protein